MNLANVPAYGMQLAELLAGVLKLDGHIQSEPKDLPELLAAARGVIAAGARIEQPLVLDATLTDGHAQRIWIVTDDTGVDVMLCPQKPSVGSIEQLEAKIDRKVMVAEYFLTPTKLAQLVDRGLMPPLPKHTYRFNIDGPDGHRIKGYTAEQVAHAQAEAVLLDRHANPRITHAPTPVFVVQLDGGTILKTSGTQAAHVIFIDADTEGGECSEVAHLLGQDYYVTQHVAETGPASADLVDRVLTELTAAQEAADAMPPSARYVVGPHWKQFLSNMAEEQTLSFVYDTEAKEIKALLLETDDGHILAPRSATEEVLHALLGDEEALTNPDSYGLEYVEEIPAWAQAAAALTLPEPVFLSLPNHEGPPLFSATHLQDHAIAYVLVDRLASGRHHQGPPSVDDLPKLPAPAYLGIHERGVQHNFSKSQLLSYSEFAAVIDRQVYARAQIDAMHYEEEGEAPRA